MPEVIYSHSSRDGLVLRGRVYRADEPSLAASGSVSRPWWIWLHGIAEHGGRWQHVADYLVRAGWNVLIPDLRGHGLSDGTRTDCRTIEEYLTDLEDVLAAERISVAQAVVFGHSFGGLLAIRWAQTRPTSLRALVLSAPLLGIRIPVPTWKVLMGQVLLRVAPTTRFKTGVRASNMTGDPLFLESRRKDPLIQRNVTARWFFAMRNALTLAHRDVGRVCVPVLAIQGLLDETTSPPDVQAWISRLRVPVKSLWELSHCRHEALNETDWVTTLDRMLQWLAAPTDDGEIATSPEELTTGLSSSVANLPST